MEQTDNNFDFFSKEDQEKVNETRFVCVHCENNHEFPRYKQWPATTKPPTSDVPCHAMNRSVEIFSSIVGKHTTINAIQSTSLLLFLP